MNTSQRIAEGVYLIGGPQISRGEDAAVIVLDCGPELVMFDTGCGNAPELLVMNMQNLGLNPTRLSLVILTHCHIDHVGGAPYFRRHYGCRLAAHELDAPAIESGDPVRTAASFYGCYFPPTPIDVFLCGSEMTISCGEQEIHCLHTPGHTPGSLSPYFDRGSRRILIGQDVHGPFLPGFGSDKNLWKASMNKLLHLKADVLCEGHFGVFQPAQEVEAYIRRQVEKNS